MKSRTGKLVAIGSMVTTLAVLSVCILFFKDAVIEEWHLRRLRSGDAAERLAAIHALGEIRSQRAVPQLIKISIQSKTEELSKAAENSLDRIGPEDVSGLTRALLDERFLDSLPDDGERFLVRKEAERLLIKFGRSSPKILLLLIASLDDSNRDQIYPVLTAILPAVQEDVGAPLVTAFRKKSVPLRCDLLFCLSLTLPRSHVALPVFLDALRDPAPDVRFHAAAKLASLGAATEMENRPEFTKAVVPALVAALEDPEAEVRVAAASALEAFGTEAAGAKAALVRTLKDRRQGVAEAAAAALQAVSPATLLGASASSDPDVRLAAVARLGLLRNSEALAALVERVRRDTEKEVRLAAVEALADLGESAEDGASDLVEVVRDEADLEIRVAVLDALTLLGKRARKAVPGLLALLKDKKDDVRDEVVVCLGKIGQHPDLVVPVLTALVEDKEQEEIDVRLAAAYALARFDSAAADAVPVLASALDDIRMYEAAAYALASVGSASVPALKAALTHEKSHVRWAAIAALKRLGTRAKEATPAIAALLTDDDATVRQAAAHLLGSQGASARGALPALRKQLDDEDLIVRLSVAISIVNIDASAGAPTVPIFRQALEGRELDLEARLQIVETLAKMGKPAVPALVTALDDDADWVRLEAVRRLGDLGAQAGEAVPALESALGAKQGDESFREAVREALKRIAAGSPTDAENRKTDADPSKEAS